MEILVFELVRTLIVKDMIRLFLERGGNSSKYIK